MNGCDNIDQALRRAEAPAYPRAPLERVGSGNSFE
jgi:hypothetical protein